MKKLNEAIKIAGSQVSMAKKLGVEPPVVFHWKKRGVPAKYCLRIERITGGKVTASDLRPDIFGDVA